MRKNSNTIPKIQPGVYAWRLPDNSGVKTCVVNPIRGNRLQVIASNDTGVTLWSVKASELKYMRPVSLGDTPYPIVRACTVLLENPIGCTVVASNKLNELIEGSI